MNSSPRSAWPWVVQQATAFFGEHGLAPQSAVVALPFAPLAVPARAAWLAQHPTGFQPAFESTVTWSQRLGCLPVPDGVGLTGDDRADLLTAEATLRQARHPALRGAVPVHARTLVDLAHELLTAVAAVPPTGRPQWWAQAAALAAAQGQAVGAADATLLQLAVAWAQQSGPPVTDVLWSATPKAVVAVFAGPSPLLDALCTHWQAAGVPVLRLGVDARPVALGGVFEDAPSGLQFMRADDVEDEAWVSTQAILARLAQRTPGDERPVALIAQDRVVVRRVRALLARRSVSIRDETGWTLSTTRAGASVMGLLRAAAPATRSDEVLGWLRSWPKGAAAEGLDSLEQSLRSLAGRDAAVLTSWRAASARLAGSHTLLAKVAQAVAGLQAAGSRRQSLWAWLQGLAESLKALGLWQPLNNDLAGTQLLQALGLDDGGATPSATFEDAAREATLDLAGFTAWVNHTLEASIFEPDAAAQPSESDVAQVVITPLARAGLRSFAATVMPGCDAGQLGVPPALPGAWRASQRQALGLPTLDEIHAATEQHWALLVAAGDAVFVCRSREGDREWPAAPLLLRSQAALKLGWSEPPESPVRPLAALGVTMPQPKVSPDALELPGKWSATAYADLRACPYRFFALRLLRLQEPNELDDELDKRDWGVWLHAVLRRFHEARANKARVDGGASDYAALLAQCAREAATALDPAQAMPYLAGWPQLAGDYLRWLREHEAAGGQFALAEWATRQELTDAAPALTLTGQIDRVDAAPQGELLLDYKTGTRATLKASVKQPGEDVQLAFYGLLRPQATQAAYLSFDDKSVEAVPLPELPAARDALASGLRQDWQRIHAGTAMPALGESPDCDHCKASGLCRKAHWATVESAREGAA